MKAAGRTAGNPSSFGSRAYIGSMLSRVRDSRDRPGNAHAALRDHRPLILSSLHTYGVWDYCVVNGRLKSEAVMTHVQLVLVIYGAVCVAATFAYIIAGLLTNAHKH